MTNSTLEAAQISRRGWTSKADRLRWARAWAQSDQTQREFAQSHGLRVGTLRKWIREQEGLGPSRTRPQFSEVSLAEVLGPEIGSRAGPWEFEIRLSSGICVGVAPGTAVERVRQLVEALRC